jgi:hypothetical protein
VMEWLRKAHATPDEPIYCAKDKANSIHDHSRALDPQWTLEGDARILKILRARGFPVDEMVPMLVELQAGRFLTQRHGSRAWNPATGNSRYASLRCTIFLAFPRTFCSELLHCFSVQAELFDKLVWPLLLETEQPWYSDSAPPLFRLRR